MGWTVDVTDDARDGLAELTPKIRRQISRHIDQLGQDPFRGDVKPLNGREWEDCFRKRCGDYRIIYAVSRQRRRVLVLLVLLRSEKTYR